MKKKLILGILLVTLMCSHDLFIKLDDYFLEPQSKATIQLFNGSFDESENVVDRNRMLDASMVGNGNRTAIDSAQWMEKNQITYLNFKTGNEGTWVAGVSTASRNIEMEAARFNKYLEKDGVIDMLESRKENNETDQDAVEKYAKHVKTVFQVGDKLSDDWKTVLGYPIEFVPQENPYDLHVGHSMKFLLLLDGKPLKNQIVGIGNTSGNKETAEEHSHGDGEKHTHDKAEKPGHTHYELAQQRTDNNGMVEIDFTSRGVWFLKTIYMEKSNEVGITHESKWATLSFQVGTSDHSHDATRHKHSDEKGHQHDHANGSNHGHSHDGESDHSHDHGDGSNHEHSHDGESDHDHDHEDEGIPSYVFWIGSVSIVAILFFVFNRRKENV